MPVDDRIDRIKEAYHLVRQTRTASVFGLAEVEAVWSNTAYAWYHVGCAQHAPPPTVLLSNVNPTLDTCAGCGARLSEPPR